MRKPDRTSEVILTNALTALVKVWCDPTDLPWDGDEPLEEGSEGFDLAVEASLVVSGEAFRAGDSVCGNWILPGPDGKRFLDDQVKELTDEAITNLKAEIKRVASRADVRAAEKRARVARSLLAPMGVKE